MYSGSNMNRPCRPQSSISRQPQTRFAKRWPASRLLYAQRPTSSNCPRAQRTPTALGTRIVPALTNCSRAQKQNRHTNYPWAHKLFPGIQIALGSLIYGRANFLLGRKLPSLDCLFVCMRGCLVNLLAGLLACLLD